MSDTACDCWLATVRIVSQCEAPCNHAASSAQQAVPDMSLSDMLDLGQNLVRHWENMNGCVNSEAHLNPQLMRIMTDAISRVLTLYEMTSQGDIPGATEPENVSGNNRINRRPFSWSHASPTFIGGVEIDDPEEIAIIAQEALKHSVIRLGAILQDIEEEMRQYLTEENINVEQPLQDSDVKELIGRLFRLLGRINELANTW